MKNMKVSAKLLLGFCIVAILALVVGAVGIVGMKTLDNSYGKAYDGATTALPSIGHVLESLQMTRVEMRNAIMHTGDMDQLKEIVATAEKIDTQLEEYMSEYEATIEYEETRKLFNDAQNEYLNSYKPTFLSVLNDAQKGMAQEIMIKSLESATPAINAMIQNFDDILQIEIRDGQADSASNTKLANRMLVIVIVVAAAAVVIAVLLGFYISGLISKPLISLTGFMKKAGSTGDLVLSPEDEKTIASFAGMRDEIGQTIAASAAFVGHVTGISKSLEVIAGGDLTVEVKMLSDMDTMGQSLKTMLSNLNNMFGEINSSTEQVSAGSKQIADGAQALAAGSTQQASSIEELAASLTEISEKTNQNADMAKEAADLSGSIKVSAEKGDRQMDQMMQAVTEINDASGSISKVIKVIDDIAFQTNILALNAAVEAARAGQHGKGFAVVAEEVRNLAAKSAEAAKDTSQLIENSIEKANLGMTIATETSESLKEIVSGINRNAEIIDKIEDSSKEQSSEVKQINNGIDQVAQVVQQNSATAEESAAASEEMSGQADLLQQLIGQFKLKGTGERSFMPATYTKPAYKAPKVSEPVSAEPTAYTPPAFTPQAEPADSFDNYNFNGANDKY